MTTEDGAQVISPTEAEVGPAAVDEPDQEAAPASADEMRAALAREGALPEGRQPAAVFYPKGLEAHADWSWRQLQLVARLCGWKFPFSRAVRKPYEEPEPQRGPGPSVPQAGRPRGPGIVAPEPQPGH